MPFSPSKQGDDNYCTSDLPLANVGLRGLLESRYVVGIALFSSLGGFLAGYDQGIISHLVTMESFGAAFPDLYTNPLLTAWCVSTLLLAASLGSVLNIAICDKIGRRGDIKINVVIFLLGGSLQAGATSSIQLFVGRAIAGWAIGALTHAIPIYIVEISTPNIRGSLVSLQQLLITVGLVVGYWISYGTSHIGGTICAPEVPYTGPLVDGHHTFNPYHDIPSGGCTGQTQASWRVPLGLQLFPALCLGVGMFFMPSSPRWLMQCGREEEALQTLSRLRQKSVDDLSVRREFLEITADVRYTKETFYADPNAGSFRLFIKKKGVFFITRKMFRRLWVANFPFMFQQNMVAIIYLAPLIFSQLGLNKSTTAVFLGFYGLVNILATLPGVLFMDRVGRRPLLISGAAICFISMVVVGALVTVYGKDWSAHEREAGIVITFLFLYNIGFSYSWGPIGWVIPSEIFPLHLRSTGFGYATAGMWNSTFMAMLSLPNFLKTAGGMAYYITAVNCAAALLIAMYFFPETKGLTLEDMDVAISKRVTDSEREHKETIYQELGLPAKAPLTA